MATKTAKAPVQGAHPNHAIAQDMATAKAQHHSPPGSLELPAKRGQWRTVIRPGDGRRGYYYGGGAEAGPDHCPGQLRTVYMRLTVGAVELNGWKQKAGKPTWTPIGIACDACLAFWRSDVNPSELAVPTNGR